MMARWWARLAGIRRELLGAATAAGYTLAEASRDGTVSPADWASVAGAAALGWLGVWVMPTRGSGPPPGPGTGSTG